MTDQEKKEQLRKDDEKYSLYTQFRNQLEESNSSLFDWFYSNLQETERLKKDKEIEAKDKELNNSERIRQSDWRELNNQIASLTVRLKAAEVDANFWKTEFEKYKASADHPFLTPEHINNNELTRATKPNHRYP